MKYYLLSWRVKQLPYFFYGFMPDKEWTTSLVMAYNETEAIAKLKDWYKKLIPSTRAELEIINSTIE